MQNFSFKRLTAWLLTLMMVFSLVPVSVSADAMDDFLRDITDYHLSQGNYLGAAGANISAAAAGSGSEDGESGSSGSGETAAQAKTTYVLAGSDFQASSHDTGATIVSGLLDKVKVDYPTMDGFLFAGDYDVNYNDSANGKAKLQETVQAVYGTGMKEIYVQGNHDNDSLVGSTLTASGANDTENYGVFVINEKDYMWYNNDKATIKKTAESLETYLNAKRNAGYTKPIFVISHLPLHYSMRTRYGGGDGKHANYIFDVLNEAGNAGLNIIFLFGHDHSHGWDDYLGGAAVFLTKGNKINIAQNSTTEFNEETLAFTYMNAGYVGYYGTSYTSDVDKTLTMTVFAITENNVTISRYASNGTHDLKSAGVYNVEYPDSTYYSTDSTIVKTPYTLALNTEIIPVENTPVTKTDSATGVSVTAVGITGVTVTSLETTVPDGYAVYFGYDITPTMYTQGVEAEVTVPVPDTFDPSQNVIVLHNDDQIANVGIADGKIIFTTSAFSPFYFGQTARVTEEDTEDSGTAGNYPEYPDEGAVKVSKTGTGIDFQSSGIAQIEVSASGVPVKKGADVIVMLDLSSSMTNIVEGKTRLSVLEASLQSLMTQLKANGEDDQPMDIRIAVADFNRYYTDSESPYYINRADHLADGSIRTNTEGTNKVYTGSRSLNANAFVSVHDLAVNEFSGLSTKSGTNYDYAFDAVYQLGEAITAKNADEGKERDLFVIFMSDGAPFQYNYFSAQSGSSTGSTAARYWNNWLQGTMTDNMFASGSNKSYYNEDGKHWMAEAIKGDPATAYPVIRKNNAADTDNDNWVHVNGLGAKMYSIGFCLAKDKEITVESMDTVIRNIASEEKYYYRANSTSDLNNAFTSIGKDIAYAAYNARFVDQMGGRFNLQMKTANYTVVDGTTTTPKTLIPEIEILSYDIYTRQDYLNGDITADRIGDRKGTYTVLETVTFNVDGTEAYSSKIGESVNILINGVINAETFWYNTTTADVTITGVSIPTGVSADGTTTGSSNILPGETFYWKMGTVQTSELAMRYYVYLDGSMEGTREGGSYATNKFATLYYDNYLGNPCKKDTVSPVMAWKEANVSYAFYLVDNDGNIIVNQTTGQTGSFANKIAVTNPVVYETVLLNNEEEVSSIDIASLGVLPEGYTLYDYNGTAGATYTVTINSNTTGSWKITSVKDKETTYVAQFDPNNASAYSNDRENHEVGHDYTHTVVWFAVLWKVQALPDSVVIDYGLPVDISVLANDMFGENGKLEGVGAFNDSLNLDGHDTTLASGFSGSYNCTYGIATADSATGKVRYTPNTSNSMQMNTYDKFAYAVHYTGNENAGYYYDTVTVIPATSIYYEESFLKFDNSKKLEDRITNSKLPDSEAVLGKWYVAGEQDNTTQSEDRPGMYSLMDANNIYGYDPAYTNYTEYSLGSARKVTVDATSAGHKDYAPTVSFTFTGKGFDVVSLTDSDAGLIIVSITGDNNYSKNYFVDNYYGYSYTAGKWVVDENSTDSIYQVPVMKVSVPTYGTYNVQIYVIYNEHFEHSGNDSSYSFYMDSVRIYDPANRVAADTVIKDAYKADGEYLPEYLLIKESILSSAKAGELLSTDDSNPENGSVFIDGKNSTDSVSDYENPGPNNEAYLANGQSISFKLTADSSSTIDKVHLGMKLAFGDSAVVKVTESWQENDKTKTSTLLEQKLETATDMYYEMTPTWEGNTTRVITIKNTSGDAVVSLTNVKITYKDAGNGTNNTGGTPAAAFLTDREVIDVALYLTRKYFIPETFEASVSRSLFGTFEIVKVVTSADAESISINGKTLTTYVPLGEERVWTDIYKKGESEEYEIIAYNADGLASVAITAAYGKTGTSFGDAMKELYDKINSIFGGIGEALGSETAEGAAETMYSVMEKLAERVFQPEFFQCSYNRTASGENQLVVNTSDDVAYIIADGEIITRYITETIVDLSEEGSETVNRVWLVPNGNETTEITAYNAVGVASETADNN